MKKTNKKKSLSLKYIFQNSILTSSILYASEHSQHVSGVSYFLALAKHQIVLLVACVIIQQLNRFARCCNHQLGLTFFTHASELAT